MDRQRPADPWSISLPIGVRFGALRSPSRLKFSPTRSFGACNLLRATIAVAGVFFVASAWPVFAQTPDQVTLTKKFSLQQTDVSSLVYYQTALEIAVKFSGNLPATTQVSLANGTNSTITLTRATGDPAGTSTFTGIRVFSDLATFNAAVPNGLNTLTFIGNGFSTTTTFNVAFDSVVSAPRFTNFDALQQWDGDVLQIFWQGIPGILSSDPVSFVLQRIFSSTEAYTLIGTSGPSALTSSSTSVSFIGVDSAPGEVLYGTLTYSHSRDVPVVSGSSRIALVQTVSVRVPITQLVPPPVITGQPRSQTVAEGHAVVISVGSSTSNPVYTWKKDGVALTAATSGVRLVGGTLIIDQAGRADAGVYTVTLTTSGGSVTSAPATLIVTPNLVPPLIDQWTRTPANVTPGENFTLAAQIVSVTPVTVTWYRNGVPVRVFHPSATLPGYYSGNLAFEPFRVTDIGSYSIVVTNSAGTDAREDIILASVPRSRITNLSVLTSIAAPADVLTLGYVLGGDYTTGAKSLVVRAVGPSLATLGVTGGLNDPRLELFAGSAKTGENDNWGGSAQLSTGFAAVGAFPFSDPLSKDAAVSTDIATRDNSVKISAVNGGIGMVLAEIYDATDDQSVTSRTPRLLNVSILKSLGTGLTVGFTIGGRVPKSVLIRAVGPTLGPPPFGVSGALADPQISLFDARSVKNAENDNWGNTAVLTASFARVGAFALPADSKDAALVTTLAPGGYSVQIVGVGGSTGVVLVEIYELP